MNLTTMEIRALEYVRNTNGGATVRIFIDDHEPIGFELYNALRDHNPSLITQNSNGAVILTEAGRKMLE